MFILQNLGNRFYSKLITKRKATRLISLEREKWHLRQRKKDSDEKINLSLDIVPKETPLSKNKEFKNIPVDPEILKEIDRLGLGLRRTMKSNPALKSNKKSNLIKQVFLNIFTFISTITRILIKDSDSMQELK